MTKGVAVTAYDLDPAALAVAKSHGATVASGPRDIGDCRIIMICVNSAEDVEMLLSGAGGLLARGADDTNP